jgi:DtxR family Mn-dependent transcriptional regulator
MIHSLTEENYLKAMFHLTNMGGDVSTKDLADHLQIKMPTVTSMLKKLASKGLIEYQSYKPARLTDKGRLEAVLIIRKHRLTEMFLVDKMGFGWEEVHEIAEQIEHVHAPAFFNKMDELLGHPSVDPHGSAIPDENGNFLQRKLLKLNEKREGQIFKLEAVTHSEEDLLNYLNKRELALGTELTIESIEPFDKSVTVSYKGRTEVLSKQVSDRLLGI